MILTPWGRHRVEQAIYGLFLAQPDRTWRLVEISATVGYTTDACHQVLTDMQKRGWLAIDFHNTGWVDATFKLRGVGPTQIATSLLAADWRSWRWLISNPAR